MASAMSKLALLIVITYWISIFISQSDIKQVSTIHQYSLACDKDKQLFWLDLGPIELGCQQFKRDLSNFEPDCIFFWSKFNQVIDATLLGILIFNSAIAQKQMLNFDEKNWNLSSDSDGDDDSNVDDEGAYDEDEGDDDGDDERNSWATDSICSLWCSDSPNVTFLSFLAVQDSSIGDLVSH